ncbi:MAG: hypothetical protein JWR60_271 [Polaromonas sp.]|nr:hypothetical protein [Polaromonas sp.]
MPTHDPRDQGNDASRQNEGKPPGPTDAGLTQEEQLSQPAAQYGGYGQGKESFGRPVGSADSASAGSQANTAGGASDDKGASHGHGGAHQQMAGGDGYQTSQRYGGYASEQRDVPGTDSAIQDSSRQGQASSRQPGQGADPSGSDTQAGISGGSSRTAEGAAMPQHPDAADAQVRTSGSTNVGSAGASAPLGNGGKPSESGQTS